MKRKKNSTILLDEILSCSSTLEPIETSSPDILAARDFAGSRYEIFTTLLAMTFHRRTLEYMLSTRGSFQGKRTFIEADGHPIAIDRHQDSPWSIWYHDGVRAHLIRAHSQ